MSKVTSVRFDDKTAELLEQLRRHYGATSYAEIFRKAIALLSLAAAAEDENAEIVIKGEDSNGNKYEKIVIVR